NMDKMHWTFPQMVARASQSVQLQPGEVLGSGTVGTGSLLELGSEVHPWLKPGDIVELEIERLGVLRHKVIGSEKTSEWANCAVITASVNFAPRGIHSSGNLTVRCTR